MQLLQDLLELTAHENALASILKIWSHGHLKKL